MGIGDLLKQILNAGAGGMNLVTNELTGMPQSGEGQHGSPLSGYEVNLANQPDVEARGPFGVIGKMQQTRARNRVTQDRLDMEHAKEKADIGLKEAQGEYYRAGVPLRQSQAEYYKEKANIEQRANDIKELSVRVTQETDRTKAQFMMAELEMKEKQLANEVKALEIKANEATTENNRVEYLKAYQEGYLKYLAAKADKDRAVAWFNAQTKRTVGEAEANFLGSYSNSESESQNPEIEVSNPDDPTKSIVMSEDNPMLKANMPDKEGNVSKSAENMLLEAVGMPKKPTGLLGFGDDLWRSIVGDNRPKPVIKSKMVTTQRSQSRAEGKRPAPKAGKPITMQKIQEYKVKYGTKEAAKAAAIKDGYDPDNIVR